MAAVGPGGCRRGSVGCGGMPGGGCGGGKGLYANPVLLPCYEHAVAKAAAAKAAQCWPLPPSAVSAVQQPSSSVVRYLAESFVPLTRSLTQFSLPPVSCSRSLAELRGHMR